MSLPLTVRVGDRHITRRLDDLSFSKSIHGAAECGFNLAEPLTSRFPAYERVFVHDGRTAGTVWDGRLEDPGRTVSDDGQRWDMSAIGETARTADRTAALVHVTRDYSVFEESTTDAPSASASAGEIPGQEGTDALVCQFNPGQPVDRRSKASIAYTLPAGMEIGGFGYIWDTGLTSPGYAAQAYSNGVVVRDHEFNTAGGTTTGQVGITIPEGSATLRLRAIRKAGATNVRSELVWAAFSEVFVRGLLHSATGTRLLGTTGTPGPTTEDYRDAFVYAHEVVADMLGRGLLPSYDAATAVIDTSGSHPIDQFAFTDGVSPSKVFDELAGLEPDFHPRVGAYDPVADRSPFAWRRWPTSVRYEMSVVDGLSLPGADAERFNQVTVRWLDRKQRTVISVYTSVVPELEAAGPGGTRLVREPEEPVDLADEVGSQANADRAAAVFLAEHAVPPASGTVTVSRNVFDLDQGRYVAPWEIEPGYLARGRELADAASDLGVGARDGKSVFRLVHMSWQASDNVASLELDAPERNDSNELAAQMTRRNRKR